MKTKTLIQLVALLACLVGAAIQLHAQGTAFTYQGRLADGAAPASGSFDLRFTLHDAASAGNAVGSPLTNAATAASNGLFTVTLDFGNQFTGANRWLEIGVRTNGGSAFTTLAPRQPITAAPYASYAPNAGMAALAGSVSAGAINSAALSPGAVTAIAIAGSAITGDKIANATITDTNIISLSGGKITGDLQGDRLKIGFNHTLLGAGATISGGSNNVAGGNFAAVGGGARNQVNAFHSFLGGGYQNSIWADTSFLGGGTGNSIQTNSASSFLGGGYQNSIQTNTHYDFLGGGYNNSIQANINNSFLGGGRQNAIWADSSFLGGGDRNSIQLHAAYSFLGGGYQNSIQTNSDSSFLGGGYYNSIQTNSASSFLGGGGGNSIQTGASFSFLGGGYGNSIQTDASLSFLGGGWSNSISGEFGVVPGGDFNVAGTNSFAAGHRAKANHQGAFVWADATDTDFASTTNNQFSVRASGGVRFETAGGGLTVDGKPLVASLSGTNGNVVAFTNGGNTFNGSFTGNGANVTNVNAATLSGLSSAGFWKTNGNTGANPTNGAFLGTADNLPLEIKANGSRALRIEPNATSPNLIGGSAYNVVDNGVHGAVIAGGGDAIKPNRVRAHNATVVGGGGNTASGPFSTAMGGGSVASGSVSTAMGTSVASGDYSLAAGYYAQAAHPGAFVWSDSTSTAPFASTANDQFLIHASGGVGINKNNPAVALDVNGTVSAGDATLQGNLTFGTSSLRQMLDLNGGAHGIGVQAWTTYFRTIGGGADGSFAWYKGGAHAPNQFDAGGGVELMRLNGAALSVNGEIQWGSASRLSVNQSGSIELGDSTGSGTIPFIDFHYGVGAAQDFNVRLINEGDNLLACYGNFRATTLTQTSDRNAKENIQPVEPRAVLEKVAALPVSQWNFKRQPQVAHLGPMAQDFKAAFGLGDSDTGIATVDESGVALAAIQGLNQKVDSETAGLRAANAELKRELSEIKQLLLKLSDKKD